ncbi:MAG: radical SAM family heme chaperone HemW [Thioploca sp.]|nr:radical SAM family heme chaperone HemW [Thioploca sp.]
MFHFMKLPSLSLYIHVPWCVHKCLYCDFNSHAIRSTLPEENYITALLADLNQDLSWIESRTIGSIFIGGGTPSVLSPEAIAHLLTEIRKRVILSDSVEVTLEANPGTVDQLRLQEFQQAGINRLSLGIQSFNDLALAGLGRIHGRQSAIAAIEATQQAGLVNFNLDILFGLPQQTLEMALQDLQMAFSFQPPHLSWYQLTIEPHTWFYHHPPPLPDEDELWEIQTAGQNYLADQGYIHYEISAYAQPHWQCQHNLNYWQFGDYLGIGAGAHGKITHLASRTITRLLKQSHPETYLHTAHTPQVVASRTILTTTEASLEFVMNALRLSTGFTSREFRLNTGLSLSDIDQPLQQACERGWLTLSIADTDEEIRIQATEQGWCFLNDLLGLFVPEL